MDVGFGGQSIVVPDLNGFPAFAAVQQELQLAEAADIELFAKPEYRGGGDMTDILDILHFQVGIVFHSKKRLGNVRIYGVFVTPQPLQTVKNFLTHGSFLSA